MSPKFQTTKIPDQQADNIAERKQAEALSQAFAVVGRLIGENWIEVNFTDNDWHVTLQLQVQTVAEVLYAYQ